MDLEETMEASLMQVPTQHKIGVHLLYPNLSIMKIINKDPLYKPQRPFIHN